MSVVVVPVGVVVVDFNVGVSGFGGSIKFLPPGLIVVGSENGTGPSWGRAEW